jgi:hypothetical protein
MQTTRTLSHTVLCFGHEHGTNTELVQQPQCQLGARLLSWQVFVAVPQLCTADTAFPITCRFDGLSGSTPDGLLLLSWQAL